MVLTRSQTKKEDDKYWKELQRVAKQTKRARKEIEEFYSRYPSDLSQDERGCKDLYTLSKRRQFFTDIYNCDL